MAEEDVGQEKTEEPTPKRQEEARKEGQIARSRELNTAALLVGGAVALWFWWQSIASGLARTMRHNFTLRREELFDPNAMWAHLSNSIFDMLWVILPLLVLFLFLALSAPMLLGGWSFSSKALAPKLDRINPMKGLKRMFSAQSFIELIKAIAKVVLVVVVACAAIAAMKGQIFSLDRLPLDVAMAQASWTIGITAILMSLTMIVVAAIDVPVQLHQHNKKLRMTLQQVKDEMKETEGRPEVKGRIRQLQRQFAESRMMGDIETADVIITNPTHYSIALRYAQDGGGAPVLVAKGVDLIAFRIREIADNHDVQIVEVPVLARALYYTTEIGDEIPEQLYLSVAQVLAYVFQLNNPQSGNASLGDVEVPEDMVFDTRGQHVEAEAEKE